RDNFAPKAGVLPRLSPEQLERETAADQEAEPPPPPAAAERAPARAAARPRAHAAPPPALRLTRDVLADERALSSSSKEFQITLKNAFIEKYKNRVTIATPFRVVHASRVHKPQDDGDQHIAGIAEEVGLPCVAELMNAKFFRGVVRAVAEAEEAQEIVPVVGAWRLWCEHPGKAPQIQDDVISEYKNANPDHVFEIHPLSKYGAV